MPNTIMLRGDRGTREEGYAADNTIKPGHVVSRNSANKFARNTLGTGADLAVQVAIEDAMLGKTINDAYVQDKIMFTYIPEAGDRVYMRVPAGAPAIVIGDRLQLDNTGCVVKWIAGTVIGHAREALDNSGGGTEAFITVEIGGGQ